MNCTEFNSRDLESLH